MNKPLHKDIFPNGKVFKLIVKPTDKEVDVLLAQGFLHVVGVKFEIVRQEVSNVQA